MAKFEDPESAFALSNRWYIIQSNRVWEREMERERERERWTEREKGLIATLSLSVMMTK